MALSIKQKLLLDLLVKIDDLMTSNGIEYELFGGSTIGALRHNGFIPWDDDIDIIIDFENYYKLEALFKDGPIGDVNLVFFHNEPNWYRSFAMLVSTTDACYTIPCMYTNGLAAGTRIDVMICDYVPKEKLEDYRRDLRLYQEILTETLFIDPDIYKYKDEYFALKKRMKKIGKPALEMELRKALESYADLPGADQLVVRFWTVDLRYYDKDVVFPPVRRDFEGYMMPVPAKAQAQLRLQYGYDWYVVPESDRWEKHDFFDNYDIPGINYHEDLLRFIDQETGERAAEERKNIRIENMQYNLENKAFRANMAAQRELMRAGVRNEETLARLRGYFNNRQYRSYCGELARLLKHADRFASVPKEHKTLPLDIMKGWLRSLICCGKYYQAGKIISSFELAGDSAFSEETGLYLRLLDLAEAYQDSDAERMKTCLDGFSDDEKRQVPDCILAEYRLCLLDGSIGEKRDALLVKVNAYLADVPDNCDILMIKADMLSSMGKEKEAMDIYAVVHDKTDNGLDLLELETVHGFAPRFGNLQGLVDLDDEDDD